jgi:hypothetical protein
MDLHAEVWTSVQKSGPPYKSLDLRIDKSLDLRIDKSLDLRTKVWISERLLLCAESGGGEGAEDLESAGREMIGRWGDGDGARDAVSGAQR